MEKTRYSGTELFLGSTILAVACLALTTLLWGQPETLVIMLCINAAVLIWMGRAAQDSLFFLFAGIFGMAAELVPINFGGAWAYALPAFFGVPLWLFFLWGTAGVYLVRAYLFIGLALGD